MRGKEKSCCYCVCSSVMEKLRRVMAYRSVMSRSKQNLLSSISVVLRTQDFSVTDSVSPWKWWKVTIIYEIYINGSPAKVKTARCLMCSVATHKLPTRSVVKGHHVQDLLLFDKCTVTFDPTWPEGRWPCRNQEGDTQSRHQLQDMDICRKKLLTFFLHIEVAFTADGAGLSVLLRRLPDPLHQLVHLWPRGFKSTSCLGGRGSKQTLEKVTSWYSLVK